MNYVDRMSYIQQERQDSELRCVSEACFVRRSSYDELERTHTVAETPPANESRVGTEKQLRMTDPGNQKESQEPLLIKIEQNNRGQP